MRLLFVLILGFCVLGSNEGGLTAVLCTVASFTLGTVKTMYNLQQSKKIEKFDLE